MKDERKTKKQLINELVELRRCIVELEESKAEIKRVEAGLVKEKNFADSAINSLPGIEEFDRRFKPKRKLLVGGEGIPIDKFLSVPALKWFE